MTDKSILSEIHQLPESLKLEVLHFIAFLKKEYGGTVKGIKQAKRVFGRSKGKYSLSPDFETPLEDFKEYR
ncbi:MAG: DUF2281 domain-containing protein [Haliscomenobacter sp.]|nr:DUF2281 domain-containing protein [Haliscomenobacter sp.]MBK8878647.1 DUF2281 domain-containing protein [Haliscomenobacter sp.]